jgi:opacity protein-like surface antigen
MVCRNRLWSGVLSLSVLLCCTAAQAQKAFHNDEASIGGFYQLTSDASGNGITDTTSRSMGGEAAFSHSFHPLMGWQFSYDYSRFTEFYTGQPFGYQHNLHVFNGDYYLHGAQAFRFRPYAMAGISAIIFSPSLNGGQNVAWQPRVGANFGAGADIPLVTHNFGLQVQYRGLFYEAPDFALAKLSTGAYRLTSEPTAGLYLRF